MTKGQFINKWELGGGTTTNFIADLEAVIATEIAKAQEVKAEPTLNPIQQAYHNYEPIRYKKWEKFQWIKKHSEFEAKTENGAIFNVVSLSFNTHPQLWELYTEPTDQPTLNPIEQAYERGEKIRLKDWRKSSYIKKQSKKQFIDERGSTLYHHNILGFATHPENWELYTEPTEQPQMTEKEKIDHILTNKLTWKPMGNKRFYANWFSAESDEGYRQVHFVDYNNPHSGYFETRIFTIDLAEWQPVETEKPSSQVKLDNSFDKERFEAMFRAVVANGGHELDHKQAIELTEEALKQLDAYYATKEGGSNE